VYCNDGNKSNGTSKGEVIAYDTSLLLRDLLPYSWYTVMVAACTVGCSRDANKTGHTLEIGNVFSHVIQVLMYIKSHFPGNVVLRNLR
jgi:hypothetical protein